MRYDAIRCDTERSKYSVSCPYTGPIRGSTFGCVQIHVSIISCVWPYLQDKNLSIEDRLKVACHLWREEKGPEDIQKAAHLFQWVSNAVAVLQKKRRRNNSSGRKCERSNTLLREGFGFRSCVNNVRLF